MSEVIKELFKDYEGAPWLTHLTSDPSPEAQKRIPELMKELEAYPMAPGAELDFLDDHTPDSMTREDVDAPHGLHFYHYEPKEINPKADGRVVYYIHGGGFMRGNEYWCRYNAIHQAENLGLPVYACEYRYTPANKYPAGVDDVEWGWNHLVNDLGLDPKKIIITGESAGGTYEMALMLRLKSQGRELPSAGCACISGFLDFAAESPSYTLNNGIDPLFSIDFKETMLFYLDDPTMAYEPEVSPKYGDFTGFPDTIFFADDTEVFVSDALIGADKLYKLGIRTEAYITHGLTHCYAFEMPELPETAKFYELMRKFFDL
ncbi:MAG: alpha/beta hydrolase [Clostridiales Family XIII bacterium]|jgi:acetyl esterase/lipase|nr:alpha/beta hydrolase [Clostridiales Family XIII bacterium]